MGKVHRECSMTEMSESLLSHYYVCRTNLCNPHICSVLYFSIHRWEHGEFWPNLRESDSDYVGEGKGKGYNINIPLNETGMDDTDYLAIVLNILLPVAYEVSNQYW